MRVLQLPQSERRSKARAQALVFEDPSSRALLTRIERLAPTDATVLITGETGTGKEIVARHVHERSARANAPFVPVNCGALSPTLFESELFGHEKGAFTGALDRAPGWFEAADGGTLFLDEIGDLPLAAQVKLLRVLQEREVVRVGARRSTPIDVRVLAATNANLEHAVVEGRFREDLFYRLHVAPIVLTPLRERPGDILPLALYFLSKYAERIGNDRGRLPPSSAGSPSSAASDAPSAELAPDAIAKLVEHTWPGNIRELENVIHHALLVSPDGVVRGDTLRFAGKGLRARSDARADDAPRSRRDPDARDLPPESSDARAALRAAVISLLEEERPKLLEDIEETVFRTVYEMSEKNQLRTARLLGVSRNIVRARLIQHGLLAGSPRETSDSTPETASG